MVPVYWPLSHSFWCRCVHELMRSCFCCLPRSSATVPHQQSPAWLVHQRTTRINARHCHRPLSLRFLHNCDPDMEQSARLCDIVINHVQTAPQDCTTYHSREASSYSFSFPTLHICLFHSCFVRCPSSLLTLSHRNHMCLLTNYWQLTKPFTDNVDNNWWNLQKLLASFDDNGNVLLNKQVWPWS